MFRPTAPFVDTRTRNLITIPYVTPSIFDHTMGPWAMSARVKFMSAPWLGMTTKPTSVSWQGAPCSSRAWGLQEKLSPNALKLASNTGATTLVLCKQQLLQPLPMVTTVLLWAALRKDHQFCFWKMARKSNPSMFHSFWLDDLQRFQKTQIWTGFWTRKAVEFRILWATPFPDWQRLHEHQTTFKNPKANCALNKTRPHLQDPPRASRTNQPQRVCLQIEARKHWEGFFRKHFVLIAQAKLHRQVTREIARASYTSKLHQRLPAQVAWIGVDWRGLAWIGMNWRGLSFVCGQFWCYFSCRELGSKGLRDQLESPWFGRAQSSARRALAQRCGLQIAMRWCSSGLDVNKHSCGAEAPASAEHVNQQKGGTESFACARA